MGKPNDLGARQPSPFVSYVPTISSRTSTTTTAAPGTTTVDPNLRLLQYMNIPISGSEYVDKDFHDDIPLVETPVETFDGCQLSTMSNSYPYYMLYIPCSGNSQPVYRQFTAIPNHSKVDSIDNPKINFIVCASGQSPVSVDLDANVQISNSAICAPTDYNTLRSYSDYKDLSVSSSTCFWSNGKYQTLWQVVFSVDWGQLANNTRYIYQWDYYPIRVTVDSDTNCASFNIEDYSIDQNSSNWKRLATTAKNSIKIYGTGCGIPVNSFVENNYLVHELYLIRCIILRGVQKNTEVGIVKNFSDIILCGDGDCA